MKQVWCSPPSPTSLTSTLKKASTTEASSVSGFSTRSSRTLTAWVPAVFCTQLEIIVRPADFYTQMTPLDFDFVCFPLQLLDREEFRFITKIKTIGSTYMAASGLTPESNTNEYTNRKVWYLQADMLRTDCSTSKTMCCTIYLYWCCIFWWN